MSTAVEDCDLADLEPAPAFVDDFADAYDLSTRPEIQLLRKLSGESGVRTFPRTRFILDYVQTAAELAFVYEQDLLDAGMIPYNIATLKHAMSEQGLALLDPRRRKITALVEHFKGAQNVPLRLLFFNSPLIEKFKQGHLFTLGSLLSRSTYQLQVMVWRPRREGYYRLVFNSRDDIFEIQIVLREAGYHLAD
jgi:hypothetical protein